MVEEQGPFVEVILSRQERRAAERIILKEQQARNRSLSHFKQVQNYVVVKGSRENMRKAEAEQRAQARVERVKTKAKPLYPQRLKKEEEPGEHQQ
jgi:hypothetical protein